MYRFVQSFLRFLTRINWEILLLVSLVLISPFLAFYNLELNPRPWHDEGSYLTLARTFAEDGVYAVRNSDGYQTFGAIQSLGPTVILPVAWAFQVFGPGLWQGRIIAGAYLLFTLVMFYLASQALFGRRSALVAVVLLLASPAVGLLMYGRPVLGEAPAFGFFMASWLAWQNGVLHKGRWWLYILSGLLLGGAIITKNQYLLIGLGSLGILALLDLAYYRLGEFKGVVLVGLVAASCVIIWYGWQIHYFGDEIFSENVSKLNALAGITMGFNLRSSVDALRFLFGTGSGYLYVFWGLPALLYAAIRSVRRDHQSFSMVYLVIFTSLWLFYFVFLIIPWSRYIFPAAAVLAIFVSKLFVDLLTGLGLSAGEIWLEVKRLVKGDFELSSRGILGLGTVLAITILVFWSGYQLQKVIREDVLDQHGLEKTAIYSPLELSAPYEMAHFLEEEVPKDKTIDTWERELGILTDHQYHYPDSALLAQAHEIVYRQRSGSQAYAILGEDYFRLAKPDYVVVGWYSRFNNLYDVDYLMQNAELITSIGDNVWGYDLYKMKKP